MDSAIELLFILWIVCGACTAYVASQRGASGCLWLFLGFCFGPFALVAAFASGPPRNKEVQQGDSGTLTIDGVIYGPEVHGQRLPIGRVATMKKCPDCAEEVRAAARKCRFCGFIFPESTEAATSPVEEEIDAAKVEQDDPSDWERNRSRFWRDMSPGLKKRWIFAGIIVAVILWAALHGPTSPPSEQSAAYVGETVSVGGDRPWICGSTKEAFDDATKWAALNDPSEMTRSLARTQSTLLTPGTRVKVLDSTIFMRQVRILSTDALSELLPPDKECWVASEALTR